MTLLYSVQAREGQANSSSGDRLSCPRGRRDTRLCCVARPGVAKPAGCALVPEYIHEDIKSKQGGGQACGEQESRVSRKVTVRGEAERPPAGPGL
ncbi:hypothetical protein R6Z07F_019141 [Ovis aries]